MNVMQKHEITWVTGVFEGEGTFGIGTIKNAQGRKYHQVYTALHMVDEDTIERLHRITGVGVMYPLPIPDGKNQQAYMWKVGVRRDAKDLILAMLPYLSIRRTLRAMEALEIINQLDELAAAKKVSTCQYEKCQASLSHLGPQTKYCCNSHRSMAYQDRRYSNVGT